MLLMRNRRAVRKGKGDLEPTRLRGGLPPVQLKDTMLKTDSGAGEQDRGLHRAEHGLCEHRMKEIRSKALILLKIYPVGMLLPKPCHTLQQNESHNDCKTERRKTKAVSTADQVRTVT